MLKSYNYTTYRLQTQVALDGSSLLQLIGVTEQTP